MFGSHSNFWKTRGFNPKNPYRSTIDQVNFCLANWSLRQTNLQNLFLDGDITSSDYNEMKSRIESELSDKQVKLERLKSTKSPFKVYLNKTLPMIENLSHYWDKADGKTKKKILGCIFTEKFENFDFESCNNIFTPEIKSIMLASKVLRRNKNKKEVKNDLLSNMAPPLGLEPRTLWLTVRCSNQLS